VWGSAPDGVGRAHPSFGRQLHDHEVFAATHAALRDRRNILEGEYDRPADAGGRKRQLARAEDLHGGEAVPELHADGDAALAAGGVRRSDLEGAGDHRHLEHVAAEDREAPRGFGAVQEVVR
jgi:hypothetical protein